MIWYVYALIAAGLVSVAAITQKKILFKTHAMEFSANLALTNLLLSLPLFFFVDWSILSWALGFNMLIVSILAMTAFLYISKAVRHMEVSAASPLLVISPAITATLAFIFLGEALSLQQIFGILGLIVGAYILETKSHTSLLEPFRVFRTSKYIHYIFFALILYGFSSMLDRFVLTKYAVEPIQYLIMVQLFIAIGFFALITVLHGGVADIRKSFKKTGWWIVLVSLFTIGYRWCQLQAVQIAYVGLVIAIKRLSTLITVIVGGELFHEHQLLRKIIASIVMLGCIALIIL